MGLRSNRQKDLLICCLSGLSFTMLPPSLWSVQNPANLETVLKAPDGLTHFQRRYGVDRGGTHSPDHPVRRPHLREYRYDAYAPSRSQF